MDRETGDVERVSPGIGKTTCAWIHPDGDRVLFASTQFDPEARNKQNAELKDREAGTQKRYAWDYDEQYDLIEWNRKTRQYTKLTNVPGYDGGSLLFARRQVHRLCFESLGVPIGAQRARESLV